MDATRILKNRRGIAIVYIALALIALVGFAALTIDIGYFYVVKGQLQNAADSAALAGASGLNGRISISAFDQYTARARAQDFAQRNTAAGAPVLLALSDPNNNNNSDIVTGCWNKSNNTIDTTCNRHNSVLVNTHKSSDRFFGKIFDRYSVNIRAKAVGFRPSKPTVPLAICSPPTVGACDMQAGPFTFYFQESSSGSGSYPPEWTTGWTEFSTASSVDLGPNSMIAQYLQGAKEIPDDVCLQNITTNTGFGNVPKVLSDQYDIHKNAAGEWQIILPIFQNCPSILQSGEANNYLIRYASGTITEVNVTGPAGSRYFRVKNVTCMDCPTATFLGNTVKLVK